MTGSPAPSEVSYEELERHESLRIMTISHAVDLWLGELERKGHSERTVDTYRRLLDKLCDCFPLIDVDELTSTQLRRFLDERAKGRNGRKAPATIAQSVTIVNGFLDWLTREGVVTRNPARRNGDRVISRPKLIPAEENDNVKTVSGSDVRLLMAEADRGGRWNERLAVYCTAYLGPRRRAVAMARLSDYDPVERMLTFHEKGGKEIAKPVPDRLAALIDSAIAAGVYATADDYLIPSSAQQRRPGERDDRIIWRLITEVADRAGVESHVHALRAAFAVQFLESKPSEIVALQRLMGHKRIETTLVYLRRLNRRQAMETVRDLDWGEADGESEIRTRAAGFPTERLSRAPLSATQPSPHFAVKTMESNPDDTLADLEPSFPSDALLARARRERGRVAPGS